ncbi:interference hedgehog-like [Uranotaenia lowii]|uniref:interference hedgehog-like n=1 Tax=Uranotaenia lowii TaxID=190385 RepID=UPI0024790C32|nr:interference hedgehog-like [Uranotaenia lowii]
MINSEIDNRLGSGEDLQQYENNSSAEDNSNRSRLPTTTSPAHRSSTAMDSTSCHQSISCCSCCRTSSCSCGCSRHNFLRRQRWHCSSSSSLANRCSLLIALVATSLVLSCSMALPHSSHHSSTTTFGSSGSSSSSSNSRSSTGSSSSSTKSLGVYMIRSPESTTAPAGDEVLFECELNLIPERLEWRFRPQDRPGNREDYSYLNKHEHNVSTSEGTYKLHVYVNSKTIGEYQCVAWFGASAIASIPARLTLASISLDSNSINSGTSTSSISDYGRRPDQVPTMMRRVFSQPQQRLRISPGNSIIIKCGEVASNPPAIWSYYKDEKAIPADAHQLPSGGLILSQLNPSDSGTYRCSAVNTITGTELKLPQKTTIMIEYTPRAPPMAIYKPQNVSATPGSVALLECPGIANPIPHPSWFRRDGLAISDHSQILPFGLQIDDVSPADQGEYMCRMDNGVEPALVHVIKLTVLEPPKIVEPPKPTLTNESDSLELECIAKGSPAPDIYWMINGDYTKWDPLIKANGSKLLIKSVEKKHAGIVQCFARNEVGETSEGNLLQVNPKQIPGGVESSPLGSVPSGKQSGGEHGGKRGGKGGKKHKHLVMIPPSRPNITRLSDESVMVRWLVPSSDGLPIQFFKVQYRMLGDPSKNIARTQWMTENEDIPPYTRSYEVNGLKSDHFYRFRIVAVYSNNDNKEGAASGKFHLQKESQLGHPKNHLLAPTLTRIEPVSQHAIVLHWQFPQHLPHPIDGFYAYYRPATTAGEYSKATVDSATSRHFKIDHLEPGTAYEFKLQSFTAAAASDFSAILTGKTLKPPTPATLAPTVLSPSEVGDGTSEVPNYVYMGVGGFVLVLGGIILCCCCCVACKKKRGPGVDEPDTKSHIQVEQNGYPGSGMTNGGPRSHHHKARNGITTRMNITPNPLAQDGDKNRNVMELRFLPPSSMMMVTSSAGPPADCGSLSSSVGSLPGGPIGVGGGGGGIGVGGGSFSTSSCGSGGGGTMTMTNNNNNNGSYPNTNNNNHHHNNSPHHPAHHHHPHHYNHHQQHQIQHHQLTNQTVINGNGPMAVGVVGVAGPEHLMLASMPHRRTLERSMRNLHHGHGHGQHGVGMNGGGSVVPLDQQKMMLDAGDCGVTTTVGAGVGIVLGPSRNNSSIRRTRRGSGSVPGSPRVGRGPSAELLQHNRSPMPIRAAASGVKRAARLGRAENMSSGSLNSIEV